MESSKKENSEEVSKAKIVLVSTLGSRGRTFQGNVTKKFEKRLVIEFERTIYVPKYERFAKKKTKLHARVPEGMNVSIGDLVKVRECRPLSKIVHFIVIGVLKEAINK